MLCGLECCGNKDWTDYGALTVSTFTLLGAGIALTFAWRQIRENRRNQALATAKTLYKDYLELAFDFPRLAVPQTGAIKRMGKWQYAKYEWYVTNAMWAWEEILLIVGPDTEWRETLARQIRYHRDYLSSTDFRPAAYAPQLRDFVKDCVGPPTGKPPNKKGRRHKKGDRSGPVCRNRAILS